MIIDQTRESSVVVDQIHGVLSYSAKRRYTDDTMVDTSSVDLQMWLNGI